MGRDHWPTSPFYWAAPKKNDGESHAGDQSDKKKNIKIYLIRSSKPMFLKKEYHRLFSLLLHNFHCIHRLKMDFNYIYK